MLRPLDFLGILTHAPGMVSLPTADVYFVSDVHWGPDSSGIPGAPLSAGALGAFGEFLSALEARSIGTSGCKLYILGDLFDFWFEKAGSTFSFYAAHIEALRRVVASGVEVTLLFGNRDFTYGELLPTTCGVQIGGDRATIEADGIRVSMQHGDLLCTGDWRYQLYRRLVRSRPVQFLASLLTLSQVTRLVGWMRRQSEAEIERKMPASMGVMDSAVVAELARGFDVVMCGHVHQVARRQIAHADRQGTLVTLGAWSADEGWFATLTGGEIEQRQFSTLAGQEQT